MSDAKSTGDKKRAKRREDEKELNDNALESVAGGVIQPGRTSVTDPGDGGGCIPLGGNLTPF
jgi:hypothetical protein